MVNETASRELWGVFPNEIIRASAGTGKTFALSNRYLKLLASGAQCQTILATTFTRKGAGEILDRIINRLSDAALDDVAAERLSSELDWNLTRPRAAKILHELLRNLHRLEISTLDSFFNRVAKAFALELHLPPTWDIVEEQEIGRMTDQAIQAVLRNETVINLLHMLTKGEASRRVASMVRETVDRIYEIYRESGPDPWDQLSLTGRFLNEADLDRILARMEAVEVSGKALKKHWTEVTEFAKAKDWAGLASNTSFQRSLDGDFKYGRTKLPPEIVEIYRQLIPHCTAYVETRLISQNQSTSRLLGAFGDILENQKDETGNLRFDDVTERLQRFVSMWDTERFSFRLDHQIQHLLLDEFQDTSLAQWNVIQPFAKNVTENQDSLRSFFCVGDMKQAIFGWRGGVAELFDLVDQQLPTLNQKTLSTSYRSSQPVIDMVNDVFLHVDKYCCGDPIIDDAIRSWPAWFDEHTTEKKQLSGYVTIEMAADCPPDLKRFEETKDRIRNRNMIRRTVDRVRTLARSIPDHHSIGVIVRTNAEVADLIFKLQQNGIAASEEGGSPLTDSAAVETVLSALQLADHPGDSIARFHLSHSPLAVQMGLEPETRANQQLNESVSRIVAADLRARLLSEGFGPTIESLARQLIDKCTHREVLRIQQLVRVAYEKPSGSELWHLRPSQFVKYIRDEVKVSDRSSARVRVMTIHKAKGLEFDVVVLPMKCTTKGWAGFTPNVVVGRESPTEPIDIATRYMGEKLRKLLPENFQSLFNNDRQRNVREAMCVLYVALTRAVHSTHIVLSYGASPIHKSPAGILLATLCPESAREEGLQYEHGDPNWYQDTDIRQVTDTFGLSDFYLPEDIALTDGTVSKQIVSGRGVPLTSPSRLEGGSLLRLGTIFEKHDNYEAIARGKLIHGCFELVSWLDESIPRKQDLELHLKSLDPTREDFDCLIAEFYEMIGQNNIKALLSRSAYQESYLMEFAQPGEIILEANRLEVQTERRFAVSLETGLLQGSIDRLVLVYQADRIVAADIIDFKSDAVDNSNLHERIEFYRPQIDGYRLAVSRFARIPLDKISTRIVFASSGRVVNLDLIDSTVGGSHGARKISDKKSGDGLSDDHDVVREEPAGTEQAKPGPSKPKYRSQQQKTFWD